MTQEVRDWTGETVPVKSEELKAFKVDYGFWDWTCEVDLFVKFKVFEVREVSYLRWDWSRERTGYDC